MIEIHSLTKTFDKIKAVDEVSVTIKNNTVFGLIGTNRAGKSTVFAYDIRRAEAGQRNRDGG